MQSIDNRQFIEYKYDNASILFSTAYNDLSFNLADINIKDKFLKLQQDINVKDICYLKQIHSDKIFECDYNHRVHGDFEADALITKCTGIAIGIFTADCVPVIIYDKNKKAAAAIHSGWRGTYQNIVGKTISKLINLYKSEPSDLLVFIGPHNKECCYEVSEDLIEKFKCKFPYNNINKGRFLNLERCIINQCKELGINEERINTMNYCTYCSENVKFHSYRKHGKNSGRQFSLIYLE